MGRCFSCLTCSEVGAIVVRLDVAARIVGVNVEGVEVGAKALDRLKLLFHNFLCELWPRCTGSGHSLNKWTNLEH